MHRMFPNAEASKPKLWPVSVEGKWGYIDAGGTMEEDKWIEEESTVMVKFSHFLFAVI